MGGWIAAAAIPKNSSFENTDGNGGFTSTRTAYLVFSIAAFLISIIEFLLNFLNMVNFSFCKKLPLELIVIKKIIINKYPVKIIIYNLFLVFWFRCDIFAQSVFSFCSVCN